VGGFRDFKIYPIHPFLAVEKKIISAAALLESVVKGMRLNHTCFDLMSVPPVVEIMTAGRSTLNHFQFCVLM